MCLAFRDQAQRENLLTQAKATGCMTPPQVKVDGEGGVHGTWEEREPSPMSVVFLLMPTQSGSVWKWGGHDRWTSL